MPNICKKILEKCCFLLAKGNDLLYIIHQGWEKMHNNSCLEKMNIIKKGKQCLLAVFAPLISIVNIKKIIIINLVKNS